MVGIIKINRKKLITTAIILVIILSFAAGIRLAAKSIFPLKYSYVINENAEIYDVDPYLVMAIIKAESGYDPGAVSHANAIGMMQITEDTGRNIAEGLAIEDYDVQMLYDPQTNIKFGVWYVNWLSERLDGNTENILAAYNAGIGNVEKWLSDSACSSDGKTLDEIPYKETENFVNRVKLYIKIYKYLY